jgi:hypothetical protein
MRSTASRITANVTRVVILFLIRGDHRLDLIRGIAADSFIILRFFILFLCCLEVLS